jgi:hypothetical protein
VLIVTHDVSVSESCPRTIHIRDGRIFEDIRREEFRSKNVGGDDGREPSAARVETPEDAAR